MTLTDPYAGYDRSVAAELDRAERKGYSPEHDDEAGLDHLLEVAYNYIRRGQTVKAGVMIVCGRAYLQRHKKNSMQEDIEEFMRRADQEVALYPQIPEDKVKLLRVRLMVEELLGSKNPGTVFGIQLLTNKSDELVQSIANDDLVGIADGLADVLYAVIGTAVAYGIDIQEVFDEVHRSNLSKTVWNEELQRYTIEKDEFGKGIKPPTYSPAVIEPIIETQILEGRLALTGDIRDA